MYIHIGTEDKVRKGADMAHGQAGGEVGPADRKNEVRHYLDRDINTVQPVKCLMITWKERNGEKESNP